MGESRRVYFERCFDHAAQFTERHALDVFGVDWGVRDVRDFGLNFLRLHGRESLVDEVRHEFEAVLRGDRRRGTYFFPGFGVDASQLPGQGGVNHQGEERAGGDTIAEILRGHQLAIPE
jgi:hypothetical protein